MKIKDVLKKTTKLLTGEFLDEIFDFGTYDLNNLGTPPRPKQAAIPKRLCPYKVERFEGDCY